MLTLFAPDEHATVYVVVWYAHGDNWVEIARLPNAEDAKAVTVMFNNGLSLEAIRNNERYACFRLTDFPHVVQRKQPTE